MRRLACFVIALVASSTLARSSSAELSSEYVQRVVIQHRDDVRACWVSAHADTLTGVVTMSWTIKPDGHVEQASITRSTLQHAKVESCLVREVSSWRFPPLGSPSVKVSYPFAFQR
jgi:TonB family protein